MDFPADKTALANRRIVDEDIQPRVLIYETPKTPTDSGWTLLLGSETRDQMSDRSSFIAPNLGWMVERYPAMLPTIKAAVRGIHVWEETRAAYRFDGERAV